MLKRFLSPDRQTKPLLIVLLLHLKGFFSRLSVIICLISYVCLQMQESLLPRLSRGPPLAEGKEGGPRSSSLRCGGSVATALIGTLVRLCREGCAPLL